MADSKAADPANEPGYSSHSLHPYDLGNTVTSASEYDQRFSYSLYIPAHYHPDDAGNFRLLVAVHGTDRSRGRLLEGFKDFADRCNYVVLAPLFPARIIDRHDMDNYKYLLYKGIRFDVILLQMIEEIGDRYKIDSRGLLLFGFSGGAHFAHRFLLLYPRHLSAVSVAAPGSVTRISDTNEWWVGTANIEKLFGRQVDLDAIRRVKIQLVVGRKDTGTRGIGHAPGSAHWMHGANQAGNNRIERIHNLWENLKSFDIDAELTTLPDVGHEETPLIECASEFFTRNLQIKVCTG